MQLLDLLVHHFLFPAPTEELVFCDHFLFIEVLSFDQIPWLIVVEYIALILALILVYLLKEYLKHIQLNPQEAEKVHYKWTWVLYNCGLNLSVIGMGRNVYT